MSLSLNCPNCGGEVGECDNSNNYTPVYYKSDKNNQPECPHCGAGDDTIKSERNIYIIIFAFAVASSILAAVL
jgi:endogenous inhibitor of DNA gyrase (YacG/DUF329 family)